MIRGKYYWWLLPLLACLLAACGDEEYYYPSVKLEYMTAYSGADGKLQSILTDEGKNYPVVEDLTNTRIQASSFVRMVSNYSMVTSADEAVGVKLYAALNTISPLPASADKFQDGVKTDPVDILAIWMGLDYLNITLEIKAQDGKHLFGFIEDKVSSNVVTGETKVHLTLYHDAGNDVQAYTKRSYLSVPLRQYAKENVRKVTVYFSVHTYSGALKTYTFDYIPSAK